MTPRSASVHSSILWPALAGEQRAASATHVLTCPVQVYVPPHPLVAHWLAILRSRDTPSPMFRSAMAELGRILIYEAARDWLPTFETQVETPLATADAVVIDPRRPVKVWLCWVQCQCMTVLRAFTVIRHRTCVVPLSFHPLLMAIQPCSCRH